MTTPPSSPSSGPTPPNPFEAMLKTLPLEIQVTVERTLRGFNITSNDDPLVQVATALGLYASYFEKIPLRITEAGVEIENQNAAHLAALDPRLSLMREFALVIQVATDRLSAVPQEIVDKFPSQAVAEALRKNIDATLKTLPLSKFEESVNRVNTSMGTFMTKAQNHNDKLETELARLQRNTADIANLALPNVSGLRAAGYILLGSTVAALLMWGFAVRPAQAQVASVFYNEGFLGRFALTGFSSDDDPVIIIPSKNIKDFERDPTTGNLTVDLNRLSTAGVPATPAPPPDTR